MYVILTSKDGQYRTEAVDGIEAVECYDYVFYGRKRAQFVIATIDRPVKVRVVDEGLPPVVNLVPSKFLEKFETLEAARGALGELTHFGDMDIRLVPAALPGATGGGH
ncbi:ferredoxin [Corticibacter populi]|uniref:Ferredoxin n=1 Tax=Corticibacter populi TaxID=1550736 RepID=A0A3M6QSD0_9BURK|nr:ferredoxin [Corticibacter populi]RMX05893.1 ferredoxin [Corticibacter populi]RZS30788.1 hypothetical protein EV687_2982 [Corticibacter populi]